MYARLQAQFRLLPLLAICVAATAASLPTARLRPALPVTVITASALPTGVTKALQKELQGIMGKVGYQLEFTPVAGFGDVTVELRGTCLVPSHAADTAPKAGLPMASTAIADGMILPKSWVNCDRVKAVLASRIADQPAIRRDYLTGRAVARLIAHELYHVLTQVRSHSLEGLAQESLGVEQLLNETSFFDQAAALGMQSIHHLGETHARQLSSSVENLLQ